MGISSPWPQAPWMEAPRGRQEAAKSSREAPKRLPGSPPKRLQNVSNRPTRAPRRDPKKHL
eukprot:4920073-Pyramimonas_sp.AAC.1